LIIEAATNETLSDQLRARIFEPLDLGRTSFTPGVVRGPYAHGHRMASHQGIVTGGAVDTSRRAASWAWAAGAIVSSTDDLARFFEALLRGRLLPSDRLREMRTLVPAGRQRYGLGIAVFPTPCGDAWGHTGNAEGAITVAWATEDASRQVILFVSAFPLTPALEDAVRRAQLAAFCDT
jgi:D-alanyl-D-alanine carboxypeptidase